MLAAMTDFATPPEAIYRGFQRVAGDIQIAGFWRRFRTRTALYADYREAHRSGDPRREIAAVTNALAGCDWTWPMWDRAVVELRALNAWPLGLSGDYDIAAFTTWSDIAEPVKVRLLVGTLGAAAYAERDIAQFLAMGRDKPRGWKQTLVATEAACPVAAVLIERYAPAIEAGDYSRLPPYVPGDGIGLRLHTPRRRPRA